MSYYFDMFFWSASSLSTAMKKAQEVVAACCTTECMRQTLEDNIYYAPSIRMLANVENWRMAVQADSTWLYRLFTFRFVYWKEHNLLGMVGTLPKNGPKATGAVYFQNSCDQDYDLKTWPAKIPFFKKRTKKFASLLDMSPKDAFDALLQEKFIDEESIQDIVNEDGCNSDNAQYYVLSALYKDIFGTLQLDDWLWGKENDAFQRFSLCGIHTIEQQYELERYLKNLVIAQVGNLGQKEVMYIPLTLSSQDNPSAYTMVFRYEYDYYKGESMDHEKAKAVIQNVVEQYLKTNDGKRFAERHNGRPNWLDAVCAVPAMEFTKAGLSLLKREAYCDAVVLDAESSFGD